MFTKQIEQLNEMLIKAEQEVNYFEESLKKRKEELRDLRAGLTSLERIQAKYEDKIKHETSCVSV